MSVFLLVAAAGDRHRKPRSHSLDSRRLRLQCGMHMSTQRNDLRCLYIIYIYIYIMHFIMIFIYRIYTIARKIKLFNFTVNFH